MKTKQVVLTVKLNMWKGIPGLRSAHAGGTPLDLESRALLALLGGYNVHSRNVDIEQYNNIRKKFDDAIYELMALIR